MLARRPRLARLAKGTKAAGFIVLVCAGVLVILVCVALMVGAGLYRHG